MNLAQMLAYGTSEGAEKAWDTRGRGRHKKLSPRAQRAVATYKPSNHAKRVIAYDKQSKVAAALKAPQTPDHQPFDVIVGNVGVEVKAFIDNTRDEITMHKESLARKVQWAKDNYLKRVYTVLVDTRSGKDEIYYKKGVGNFRLGGMTQLSGYGDLKRVIK